MRCGGATRVVDTWHVLICGVNAPICMTLGFPARFQFFEPWFLNFYSSHFPFYFPKLLIITEYFLPQPFSATLLRTGAWLGWASYIPFLRYAFLPLSCYFSFRL